MIDSIELHNFLPFGDETVTLHKEDVIAILGDNGKGKSSLLESLRFCLFGEGRDDFPDLVRIGAEDMSVTTTFTDIPKKGSVLKVSRSINEKGAGKTFVYLNKKLVEKGGARPSNNPAQEFLNNLLGTNDFFFTLTSFFGFGISDTLMQVKPSERLETLQKLAKVDACAKINKISGKYRSHFENEREQKKIRLEALQEIKGTVEELQKSIDDTHKQNAAKNESLDKFQAKRVSLMRDLDRFSAVTREYETLRSTHKDYQRQIDRAQQEIEDDKSTILDNKESSEINIDTIRKVKEALRPIKLSDDLQSWMEDLATFKTMRSLKEVATQHSSDSHSCPLCDTELDPDVKKRWKVEVKKYDEDIARLEHLIQVDEAAAEKKRKFTNQLTKLQEDEARVQRHIKESEENIEHLEKEVSKLKVEQEKAALRLKTIKDNGLIDRHDEVLETIKGVDTKISSLQREIGSLSEAEKNLEKEIEIVQGRSEEIDRLQTIIKQLDRKIHAFSLVEKGFSRYEIPVTLLSNLRSALETRSSVILKQFVDARIKIIDTEGARPGVEFVMIDEVGRRKYKSLSTGEKVLVFLAVRLALAEIINSDTHNHLDFVVLDEIAGNISEQKREALTRFINTSLKKHFRQIFVVSHVPLRNIFSRILRVFKKDGVSVVKDATGVEI